MIPSLRMVTISFTPEEVAERAAEVRLPVGERIDEPDVLTAIRLAFVAPEPGDELGVPAQQRSG